MSNENQLTESQLFTIEALNRIDGFFWPDGANFASMDDGDRGVDFWSSRPEFDIAECTYTHGGLQQSNSIHSKHPDWRNSLITKEEFDSIDGWVRVGSGGVMPHGDTEIDIKRYPDGKGFQSGSMAKFIKWGDVKLWRYHKQANEEVIPEAVNQSIDQLINACNAWQKAKANYDTSRAILQLAEKDENDAREAVYCALRAVWWGAK